MKHVYCSQCGTKIQVIRKALPRYARIIDVIQPHTCPEGDIEIPFDPEPFPFPADPRIVDEDKFIKKINELAPPLTKPELKDRRAPEHIKSSAPEGLRSSILNLPSSDASLPSDEEPENE